MHTYTYPSSAHVNIRTHTNTQTYHVYILTHIYAYYAYIQNFRLYKLFAMIMYCIFSHILRTRFSIIVIIIILQLLCHTYIQCCLEIIGMTVYDTHGKWTSAK